MICDLSNMERAEYQPPYGGNTSQRWPPPTRSTVPFSLTYQWLTDRLAATSYVTRMCLHLDLTITAAYTDASLHQSSKPEIFLYVFLLTFLTTHSELTSANCLTSMAARPPLPSQRKQLRTEPHCVNELWQETSTSHEMSNRKLRRGEHPIDPSGGKKLRYVTLVTHLTHGMNKHQPYR